MMSVRAAMLMVVCAGAAVSGARAQTWDGGRATGTSTGAISVTEIVTPPGGSPFTVNLQGSHAQFQALSIVFTSSGGGGSTGGGLSGCGSTCGSMNMSSSLAVTASTPSFGPGLSGVQLSASGSTVLDAGPLVIPVSVYNGWPSTRQIAGNASSTGLLEQLKLRVGGTRAVYFEVRAAGALSALQGTFLPTPDTTTGAAVVGRTLAPGSYFLPNVSLSVSTGTGPGPYTPSVNGSIAIVLGSPVTSCYANCDGSTVAPTLNALDFSCFLTKYVNNDPYANCDGSTTPPVRNALDFSCFLTQYAAGCV